MKSKLALLLLIPLLLSGCIIPRHGRYVASELTDGWRMPPRWLGPTYFKQRIPRKPNWIIVARRMAKGKLDIYLSSTEYDPDPFFYSVKNSSNTIHIILHDRNERDIAINAEPFVWYHHQLLDFGDSEDFTLILPPFTIGDTSVPQFSARFTWSERIFLQLEDIGL